MLLPSFIRYNAGCMHDGKEERLVETLGVASMGELADTIEGIKERMNLPNKLGQLGLTKEDVTTVVDNGFRPDRVFNNPRDVSREDLTAMLKAIL
jgi:alcohol dehydrogenase class IV